MGKVQIPIVQPGLRVAGFLPPFTLREQDLARDGKNLRIDKALQQRGQKVLRYDHVVVEQHHDIVAGGLDTTIVTFAKSQVLCKLDHADLRIILVDPRHAVIATAVVDQDDLMILSTEKHRLLQSGQTLFQKRPSVPVEDHNRADMGRDWTSSLLGFFDWFRRFSDPSPAEVD